MSFRELRNFQETMKALGYPRHIGDSFRKPNFELTADCLFWLFKRYDPGAEVTDDISTESDRVLFLQSIAQSLLLRARVRLNLRRLYAADGAAIKELLKLASLLHKAGLQAHSEDAEAAAGEAPTAQGLEDVDARAVRQLSSEITRTGAALHDALQQERELQEARQRAIGRNTDSEAIERSVREAVAAVNENAASVQQMIIELDEHTRGLAAKTDKRRAELERAERRLGTLAAVRPAYMDELERLQGELQDLFALYLRRFRNLDFLEGRLEEHRTAERSKMEAADRALRRMQKRLREEELRILRGEAEVDEAHVDDGSARSSGDDLDAGAEEQQRPKLIAAAAGRSGVAPAAAHRAPGTGPKHLMPLHKGEHSERQAPQHTAQQHPVHQGGQVMGTLTGPGSDSGLSGSILDDSGSGSTHISMGGSPGTAPGQAMMADDDDLGIGEDNGDDLSDGDEGAELLGSEDNDF